MNIGKQSVIGVLAVLAILEVTAVTPRMANADLMRTQFQGSSSLTSAGNPSDMAGAVDNNGIVQMVNGSFTVYDFQGNATRIPSSEFWTNAGIDLSGSCTANGCTTDPRVIYDPASGHFFASEITFAAGGNPLANHILVATSDSSDPRGPWHAVSIDSLGPRYFADFDTLSVDQNAVTIGVNYGGTSGAPALYTIPKASLIGGTTSGMTSFTDTINNYNITTFQGATNAGTFGPVTPTLSTNFASNSVNVNYVQDPGSSAAILTTPLTIPLDPGFSFPHDFRQPGPPTNFDTFNINNISSSVYQVGDHLLFARTVWDRMTDSDGIEWGIMQVTRDGTAATLVQDGIIARAGLDFYYPSIAYSPKSEDPLIVIAYNGSGPSDPINAYASLCTFTSCFSQEQLTHNTIPDYYLGGRWGDYSAVAVNASSSYADYWLFQSYPIENDAWGTAITEIAVPEPSSLGLLAVGLVGIGLIRRRKGRQPRLVQARGQ